MSGKTAIVFIDGNNFYHNVKLLDISPSKIDFLKLTESICSKFNLIRKKTIYYNSVPNIKIIGEEKYYKHMKFLSGLEKLPKFVVKTRKLQKKSHVEVLSKKLTLLENLNLCEKCKPIVTQNCINCVGAFEEKEKGIDVMIAVDMIEMALKNEYDCAILISGDADFIPMFELIKNNGKKVVSAFVTKGYSTEIKTTQQFAYLDQLVYECLKETIS